MEIYEQAKPKYINYINDDLLNAMAKQIQPIVEWEGRCRFIQASRRGWN